MHRHKAYLLSLSQGQIQLAHKGQGCSSKVHCLLAAFPTLFPSQTPLTNPWLQMLLPSPMQSANLVVVSVRYELVELG